jgi:hypothetical protein
VTRRQIEKTIGCLGAVTAAGAVGGAAYGLRGAPNFPREWLEGSPFRDYRVPSLILGAAVGGSSAASAVTAWRGNDHAGAVAVFAGTILTGWIVVQVAIIGPRSFLQPTMCGVGIAMAALGVRLRRHNGAAARRIPIA